MSGYTLAAIILGFFTFGFIFGGFIEWDVSRDTRKALRAERAANEELRQFIHNNLGNPSASTKSGH